ncbi:MAG: PKD domain-containing protein [Anaerolineae bacterium]|nr:PKD domain-containing protein [Anaerolineae bacterium]
MKLRLFTLLGLLTIVIFFMLSLRWSIAIAQDHSLTNSLIVSSSYEDPLYGFSIRYPEDWEIRVASTNQGKGPWVIEKRLLFMGETAGVNIDVFPKPQNYTLDEWYQAHQAQFLPVGVIPQNLVVAGKPALYVLDPGDQHFPARHTCILMRGNFIYRIEYQVIDNGDSFHVYQEMLSTLKFTGTQNESNRLFELPKAIIHPAAILDQDCCDYEDPNHNPYPCHDGNCTWWARYKRPDTGGQSSPYWGDARYWAARAAEEGFMVNSIPSTGALAATPHLGEVKAGWENHVAYVESCDGSTIHFSEMNYGSFDCEVKHKYIFNWQGIEFIHVSDNTCSAPFLSEPADGIVLSDPTVTFRWSTISDCAFCGYAFRVCTSPDIENAEHCFIDTTIVGTSHTATIDDRDNQDLYWGVKAANDLNGAAWSVLAFRIAPEPHNDGQANGDSRYPVVSDNGRYVAFTSAASNLIIGDANAAWDVFVYDRQTGQTSHVSRASNGSQGNGDAVGVSISADGRYVAFASEASNLVNNDSNEAADIFVHDRQTGETRRVSLASDGAQGNEVSWWPDISADGRYIAFYSDASNLVAGDSNGVSDVFVHDTQTGQTERVSIASNGMQGNDRSGGDKEHFYGLSISADGRYVAFYSYATNLVSNDINGRPDVFVHDRESKQTYLASPDFWDAQYKHHSQEFFTSSNNVTISDDGSAVAFASYASTLVSGDINMLPDIFIYERALDHVSLISQTFDNLLGNGASWGPTLSGDGRYMAFNSEATNLLITDTNVTQDIFIYDRETSHIDLISRASDGDQGNQASWNFSLSTDGRYVAFHSEANNLVPPDTNNYTDVFIYDRVTGQTEKLSQGQPMQDSDGDGLTDCVEIYGWHNAHPDAPFKTDPQEEDSDDDNLNDGIEKLGNTHPNNRDTDGDSLPDGVEDVNHNGIVEKYETDPKFADSDGDDVRDDDDPVPVKLDNRKALVIWVTEYQGAPELSLPLPFGDTDNPDHLFSVLGFDVTSYFDAPGDGQFYTYDRITNWIKEFADELDEDDVAVVFIATHGVSIKPLSSCYLIAYGDDLYYEDKWCRPISQDKVIRNQLMQIGPALDFLWLRTCWSWNYLDEVDELGAEGIIFYGANNKAYANHPESGFYKAIAGADAGGVQFPSLSLEWLDYYDESKAQRNVEDVIDDVNLVFGPQYQVWEMYDNRAGNMNLLDFNLSRGATENAARVSQFEATTSITPTLSLRAVSYVPYDSNADNLNDGLEIGWVAGTSLPQETALAKVAVYNDVGELQQHYLVGPYTVSSGAIQTMTVNFFSTSTLTYEVAIELYTLPYVLADLTRSNEIGLNAGPGKDDGDERFINTNSHYSGTLIVDFSIATTAITETMAVVGTLATHSQFLNSVAATVRSPDYLVTRTTPITGHLSFSLPTVSLYYANLYLVDQNNYVEDVTQIHPWFTGVYTERALDINDNGLYEQLVIEVGLCPSQPGDYVLEGRLYDAHGNHIVNAVSNGYLTDLGGSLPITFAGSAVRRRRLDGPYELRDLAFYNTDNTAHDSLPFVYETSAYTFTAFEIGSALLNDNYRDYLLDDDGDGYAEALGIDVDLACALTGTYTLEAALYDTHDVEVGRFFTTTFLTAGESTMALLFNAHPIGRNGVNGPYMLKNLRLRDTAGKIVDQRDEAYQTAVYQSTQFQAPGALLLGSYADYGLDTDGDGLYNYLAFDVALNVNQAGVYQLDGMITETVPYTFPWANNRTYLPMGIQTTTLYFDGEAIRESGVSGRFWLAHIALFEDTSGELLDSNNNCFTTTQIYTHTQFQIFYVPVWAHFVASPTLGFAPLTVTFSNTSSGGYTSSIWDFGDGETSMQTYPTHTYTLPGVYTIALTVSGRGGTDTVAAMIAVYTAIRAGFIATPTSGIVPLTVVFTDTSSGAITSWLWTFGDGVSSVLQNPTHTYMLTEMYTVGLTVRAGEQLAILPGGNNTLIRANYIDVSLKRFYLPVILKYPLSGV